MLRPVATRGLPLLLILCVLAGCGDTGPSDEQQIRQTLSNFERAAAGHDYAALCDRILAPKLIGTLEQIGLPCETALQKGLEDLRDPRLSVGTVTVDGDRATAQVRSSAAGQSPSEDTVDLVRAGDGWRIASLGGTGAG
jgi:hypothetical protein